MRFLIVLEQTETGFAVQAPDLAIATYGENIEAAKRAARDAGKCGADGAFTVFARAVATRSSAPPEARINGTKAGRSNQRGNAARNGRCRNQEKLRCPNFSTSSAVQAVRGTLVETLDAKTKKDRIGCGRVASSR
jgi:hypothetical protein